MLKKFLAKWRQKQLEKKIYMTRPDPKLAEWNQKTTPTEQDAPRIKRNLRILGMLYFALGIGAAIYFSIGLFYVRQYFQFTGSLNAIAYIFYVPAAITAFVGLELYFLKRLAYKALGIVGFFPSVIGISAFFGKLPIGPVALGCGLMLTAFTMLNFLDAKTQKFMQNL